MRSKNGGQSALSLRATRPKVDSDSGFVEGRCAPIRGRGKLSLDNCLRPLLGRFGLTGSFIKNEGKTMLIFPAALLSLKCLVELSVSKNISANNGVVSVVGKISSNNKRWDGKPCLGVATMLADRTLIFSYTDEFSGQKHRMVQFEYKPGAAGYKGAIETVGGIKPGEERPIPPVVPTVGFVSMATDGVLTIQLRTVANAGTINEGMLVIKPDDSRYREIVRQIGIEPGQSKPMPIRDIDGQQ